MAVVSSRIYQKLKRALAAYGIVVRASNTSDLATDPTISSGSGAPSEAEPNGSIYLRTGGAAATTLYLRVSGAWVAVSGLAGLLAAANTWTAANTFSHATGVTTDTLTERTAAAGVTVDGTLLKDGGVTSTGAITTTDGVGSGTARKVGGLAYAATAAVTLTNTTNETTLGSYTVPANTLKAGTVMRFRAAIRVTGNAAADTITFRGKLGSTALLTSAAVAMIANDIAIVEGTITARAAPGAAAEVASNSRATVTVGGSAAAVGSVPAPSNVATNGALVLALTGQWNAASASDIAICDQFDVWVDG